MAGSDTQGGCERQQDLASALRQGEERLRRLLAAMAEGVVLFDRDGAVTAFNERALGILRCTPAQVRGEEPPPAHWRLIHEDGSECDPSRTPARLVPMTGEPVSDIVLGVSLPDRVTWISVNAQPLLSEGSQRQDGAVVTITDITESRERLRAVRDAQDTHRAVLAAMTEGMIVLDHDLQVVASNESATQILGGPPRDVVGRDALPGAVVVDETGTLLEPERHPCSVAVLEGRTLQGVILGCRRPEGSLRWLSVNSQPVSLPGDRGRGAVLTITDVTERRAVETERQRLAEQLRQSQKMEAVGTLASGIAHDFNNVLAAILGNADLIRMDLPQEHPGRARLNEIESAGERGRDLVQRLLTFARRRKPRRRELALAGIVDDVLRLLRPVLPESIRIEQDLDATAIVMADETEMHQVLLNLCTNAATAIGDAQGSLRVLLASIGRGDVPCPPLGEGPPGERWVRLSVTDDGCGMDDEVLGRIFDPFFTTRPIGTGTGLGLSVVHGIVSDLGGCMTVQSAPGEGARFDVCLPAAAAHAQEIAPGAGRVASVAAAGSPILFVDDDPSLVALGVEALQRGGFRVVGHRDPIAALAEFRTRPRDFALVVTDVLMPGLSGLQLAGEIRRLNPDVPLVLTSAVEALVSAESLRRLAPARLALKPWSHVGLVELARTTIG